MSKHRDGNSIIRAPPLVVTAARRRREELLRKGINKTVFDCCVMIKNEQNAFEKELLARKQQKELQRQELITGQFDLFGMGKKRSRGGFI